MRQDLARVGAHPLIDTVARKHLRYGSAYPWLILAASLDIILTAFILQLGGVEVNALAAWAINTYGRAGIVGWKFLTITAFILVCEVIGARDARVGRFLSNASVAINAAPVVYSMSLLAGA